MDTDVLVVGAGPTGLMLAIQLVRRDVRVHIIDRNPGPSLETRALGVQARTLEIYSKLGIVDRALELGKRGTGANIWAQGRKMARVPLGEAGQNATPYPFILILGQDDHAIPPDPINDVELTRTRIPQPSFYLVRPDGHVGLCGGRLEAAALRCYVAECLRLGVEVRDV